MIRFKDSRGEFEFDKVEDLKSFFQVTEITDHDIQNLAYLCGNLANNQSAFRAFLAKGKLAVYELRDRGMTSICKELQER